MTDNLDEIEELRDLAARSGAVLYQILYRNAGVGFEWWEEERAGPEPVRPQGLKGIREHTLASRQHTLRGLVIYRYHPTLREAIKAEKARLRS